MNYLSINQSSYLSNDYLCISRDSREFLEITGTGSELRPRNENFVRETRTSGEKRETRTSAEKRELRTRNENFVRETRTSAEKRELRPRNEKLEHFVQS